LQTMLEDVGWSDVRFYRLTWGIVALHVGTKA
jgi:demethylmenaquinone methyltransferase/2-methoxy-6-polyprenyl-1,4-benzoquinol methylase